MGQAFLDDAIVMRHGQQSAGRDGARWPLAAGAARRLTIGPGPRWLLVERGRVWLTTTGGGAAMEQDRWLLAGDAVQLPAGTEVVLEAWGGDARFELLVPPQACGGFTAGRGGSGLVDWGRRLLAAARRVGAAPRAYAAP